MANQYNSRSRYRNTNIKDFYLDIWNAEGLNQSPSVDDTEYVIESRYDRRPDLLANELYGDPSQWWRLAMRNKDILIDPIDDFTSGTTIWVPSTKV